MFKTTFLLIVALTCVWATIVPTIYVEREKVFLGVEKLKVHWSLYNDGEMPVSFLKYGTPLDNTFQDTLTANMFEINNEDGASPIYLGVEIKRDILIENFVLLRAKTEVSGQIILSDAYHFTEEGTYTIRLATVLKTMERVTPIVSNEVTVSITGSTPFVYETPVNQAVTYSQCTGTQQNTVGTAISNAISASSAALSYLNRGCRSSYTTWFGTYSASNYNTVNSGFNSIYSNLNAQNFGINCGCTTPGTYAYVYPSDPSKTIYLCPVFWDAPANAYSYNSKPGTLTHEMSHFTAVAGTSDYQYGVSGCLNLAQTNPGRAIKNADSYEYFQESNPNAGAC